MIRPNVRQTIAECVSDLKKKIDKLEENVIGNTKKDNYKDKENLNQLYNVKVDTYGNAFQVLIVIPACFLIRFNRILKIAFRLG